MKKNKTKKDIIISIKHTGEGYKFKVLPQTPYLPFFVSVDIVTGALNNLIKQMDKMPVQKDKENLIRTVDTLRGIKLMFEEELPTLDLLQ